jgi:hypothetical protein
MTPAEVRQFCFELLLWILGLALLAPIIYQMTLATLYIVDMLPG